MPARIINLISSPRNVSTALMYSFAQNPAVKVVDEPFYAYYLTRVSRSHPGQEEIIASQSRQKKGVLKGIQDLAQKHPWVFLKNMAHHLVETDYRFLEAYQNVFLIRQPAELIHSFSKVISEPSAEDIGVQKQGEIFDYLCEVSSKPPLVLDSGELLKNPAQVLEVLCQKLGLEFDRAMLHWEAKARPEDGVWAKYWYDRVHQSQGFHPRKSSPVVLAPALEALLEESWPIYQKLLQFSIKAE